MTATDPTDAGAVLPVARTSAEAHVYLAQLRCTCDAELPAWRSSVIDDGDGLAAQYETRCSECDRAQVELFRLTDLPVDVSAPGGLYGAAHGPSELVDAVTWRTLAEHEADAAGAGEAHRHRHLSRALAAITEAALLVDPQTGAVPRSSLRSDASRAAYDADPGAYRQDRLLAVKSEYRRLLDDGRD